MKKKRNAKPIAPTTLPTTKADPRPRGEPAADAAQASANALAKPELPTFLANPVDQVQTWILTGASEAEVSQAIDKYWPGEKPRPLLVAAMKKIAAAADVDAASLRGWCIEATRTVYQRALEAQDYGAALRAIKQLAAFAGTGAE